MSTNWAPIATVPTDGRDVQVTIYPGARQHVARYNSVYSELQDNDGKPILPTPTQWRDVPDAYAAAVLTSISPTSASKASGNFTLTVNGTGFQADAVVSLNGAALTTTYVSAIQVTAAVVVAALTPGDFIVTLANGANTASNEQTLTLTA